MNTSNGAVTIAKQHLAAKLDCAPDELDLIDAEAVEWNDSALGCPQPGMMYMQVITPGYRIVLAHDGKQYTLHTDRGTRAVLCEGLIRLNKRRLQ